LMQWERTFLLFFTCARLFIRYCSVPNRGFF
jgi:hypothetical protein